MENTKVRTQLLEQHARYVPRVFFLAAAKATIVHHVQQASIELKILELLRLVAFFALQENITLTNTHPVKIVRMDGINMKTMLNQLHAVNVQ